MSRARKISARALQGGGKERPITNIPLPMPIEDKSWFGPGQPMNPGAPASVAGRRNDFNSGYNLNQQPRAYEPVSAQQLRDLADGYDLLRLCIETRKDQMARLKWTITPRNKKSKIEEGDDLSLRIAKIETYFRRPDRVNFWGDWLRGIVEDLLVLDAPAVHVRRTVGGDLYSLDQIDGATIKRVIDEWGRTPEPPFAAYQQILKGLPAVNYTSKELIYRPRNLRVHKFYGYSPVEQIVMTISIGLRRQMWQLAYFTDGNLPDSLIGVPVTWTPDQIRQFQDWFDSMLLGNISGRRSAKFVPGEVAKSYVPTKEAEMFGGAEEWLSRVVCYCFGLSHQALVKEVNRATAETAQEQAMADGLAPIMAWVKGLIDSILIDQFDENELEFDWVDEREMDPKVQSEILIGLRDAGLITTNEARGDMGRDPDPSPEANLLAASRQFIPISTEAAIEQKQRTIDAFPPPPPQTAPGSPEAALSDQDGTEAPEGEETPPVAAAKGRAPAGMVKSKSPADRTPLSLCRPAARRARASMEATLTPALEKLGDKIAAQIEKGLRQKGIAKAADSMTEGELNALIDSLDFTALIVLINEMADDLGVITSDASKVAIGMIGVEDRAELFDRVNARAVARAEERAAELVGKRILADGSVIDNPNPKWAITDTTRDMVRETIRGGLADNIGSEAIIEALQTSYAFSAERAEMISRTEIARANSDAAMETYREAAKDGIKIKKQWILGPAPCEDCEKNADQGPIDLEDDFQSGDDATPAHPNCVCATTPVVTQDE